MAGLHSTRGNYADAFGEGHANVAGAMQGPQTIAVRHKKDVVGLHLDILRLQAQDLA